MTTPRATAPKAPADRKPKANAPFVVDDGAEVAPWPVTYKGKDYELPGECTPDFLMIAIDADKEEDAEEKNRLGAELLSVFMKDVIPAELRKQLRSMTAIKSLLQGWSAHIGLGEELASAES